MVMSCSEKFWFSEILKVYLTIWRVCVNWGEKGGFELSVIISYVYKIYTFQIRNGVE